MAGTVCSGCGWSFRNLPKIDEETICEKCLRMLNASEAELAAAKVRIFTFFYYCHLS
jgi:hypothetical protein